ncbi:MAG: selenocysteine-specific translation elongation factor [Thermoleophilia bacterium]
MTAPLTLGTAGHIDHGKTALVGLLTGKNTDRLREERDRGISIELGYADLVLPGGRHVSIIDVPGHERFVRTMVAGATGIDLFLLVVAADDGVMPQTREHLAILDLLGVRNGVVALTKADTVDTELLELAQDDVRDFLASTPFANCDVVPVSARDGRGKEALLAALERAAARHHAERKAGPARLPIDRVFTLRGIGTVVTGTLWQGHVRVGDALVVEPGAIRTTVRSVQAHDRDTEVADAGSRVGLNMRGLDREDVRRGCWLVAPQLAGHVSRRFDAWVTLLPGSRPLRSGDLVRLHHGTAQFLARVVPLIGRDAPGEASGAAVVRLDAPAALEPRDRFILRSLSPVSTIGGGEVLTVAARRWHERERHNDFLLSARAGDARRALAALAADAGTSGFTAADLLGGGFGARESAAALAAAEAAGELESSRLAPAGDAPRSVGVNDRWFRAGLLDGLRRALLAAARERANAHPERPFTAAAELAALIPELPLPDVETLLQRMRADGVLITGEGGFAPSGAGVLSEDQAALATLLKSRLRREPFAPPTLALLAEEFHRSPRDITQVLETLARRDEVVRVDRDLWFDTSAVNSARDALHAMLTTVGEVTLASFRDRMSCGRRNAQALLELFDREGLTLRKGDVRVARRRR